MDQSFSSSYLQAVGESKACREFHIWTMLATMSALAGKRFWFPFGRYDFYCNIYVVLVGDPGTAKSTAMEWGKNIVRAVGTIPVAATQNTKEAITQEMSGEKFKGRMFYPDPNDPNKSREFNQYSIFATELTHFMGVNPLGMVDFLTTIWNEPVYEVKTKHQGNDYIKGPYITMCACMTPEIVKGYLKQNILSGGFARRTAWMFSNLSNEVPIPTYTDEQKKAELACVEFGKMIQTKSGAFGWSEELKAFYLEWNHQNERTKRLRPPTTRGWYESKPEMLFKLSMLIALSNDGGERLILELPHYKMALAYCELLERNLDRVFEGSGINPNAQAVAQVCSMLEAMDAPMNEKVLLVMFMGQVTAINELKDTLDQLVSVGRLARLTVIEPIGRTVLGTLLGSARSIASYKDRDPAELHVLLKKGTGGRPPDVQASDHPSLPDLPDQP